MAVKNKVASKNKRSLANRDEPAEKPDVFPTAQGIDVPSEPEQSSDEDDDVEEGDFDEILKEMAEDQGFSSADEEIENENELDDDDSEGEDDNDGNDSEIHSSDIEGASSEEGEEADSEDIESDNDDISPLERTNSRLTDGQETAVDSDDASEAEAKDEDEEDEEEGEDEDEASKLANEGMEKLTIRDFGSDLSGWKEYRKTLPQIDAGYASDSSTEEPANTIGSVPIEWYEDYSHIGYDLDGKRIMRPATADELDKFLDNMDNPDVFRTARDEINQKDVKLSEEEIDIIRRIHGGDIPDANYNPYEDTVEWFTSQTMVTPLSGAMPSKRGFIPSKWEHKRIMKIVRAIRQGRITRSKPKSTKPKYYDVWEKAEQLGEKIKTLEGSARRPRLPAPRAALPAHEESYHPPPEYLPTEKEKEQWENQIQDSNYRKRSFLPQDFGSLRAVPGYDRFIQERFQRCLDLYLAPRMMKKTTNLNAEELIPRLPDPRDLRPFPSAEALMYVGHTGRVRSISVDPTGLWLLSGSDDGTVRMWELVTGRCSGMWDLKEVVYMVSWNPNPDMCMFAAAVGGRVVLVTPTGICDDQKQLVSEEFVRAGFTNTGNDDEDDGSLPVSWDMPTSAEQASGIRVSVAMHKTVKSVAWHRRGDYMASLTAEEGGSSVLIHQVGKHKSQRPFRKLKGAVQAIKFHPTRPWFLVTTQRYVRIYNLMQQMLIKTLQPGVKWISSVDVHPQGDNVIVGSYDKKLSWFDLDLSVKPYKSIRYHKQAIRQVQFSRRFPLFATVSDDGTIQVYHGMVYQDLNQNPLIVPLKILRGHEIRNSLGVLDCVFHPIQPWLLSSGADGTIRLWT
ncbi:Ribosome biogenesis protein erb1 [Coemansia spiralis]|uniref:Ribosome biogenesis protein ERB1 n=2 Tax=Coemansia TaxID=4863 RepID=A0A9W8G9S2_9FUNG|nr:Ribosome biogenesis protein erb1 [Coemansia umbellata]KAJ2622224.1 Ribosome biogenesis protein erb1 [Coemansia sp. RSA 1358]KAJ2677824.1 Ribosome biogenesis protein erb1 [Coemansia spiralis]